MQMDFSYIENLLGPELAMTAESSSWANSASPHARADTNTHDSKSSDTKANDSKPVEQPESEEGTSSDQ